MEVQVKYSSLEERANKIKEYEAQNLRMLHDDFPPDWESGDESYGTMTFTDEPSPVLIPPEPVRDYGAEIDKLEARIEKLEGIIWSV